MSREMFESTNGAMFQVAHGASLAFRDIEYQVKDKQILKGVSGGVPAGKLLAILGPSGSGKSTLLDVLAQRRKTGVVTGTVLVDGRPRPPNFNRTSGYVMQDEALIPRLTVRETLLFTTRLRVAGLTETEVHERVSALIRVLRLSKVADTRVGSPLKRGISGGERRRLGIGIEVVTNPGLLFIDEPTTGLDSHSALRVVKAIVSLSENGCTIITTIHQPSSSVFHMFDWLLLLAEGDSVYFGPRSGVLSHFASTGHPCPEFVNPADYLLDLLSVDVEDDAAAQAEAGSLRHSLADAYRKSSTYSDHITNSKDIPASPTAGYATGLEDARFGVTYAKQLRVLTSRTWLATIRDPSVMLFRTGAALAIAILVGGIYFQQSREKKSDGNRINVILFVMCVFSLFCLPAISQYVEDRLLYTRERASGFYSPSAYFIATSLVEMPPMMGIVLLYGTVCYWMVGLYNTAGHFFFFVLTIFLVISVGFGVAQTVSAAAKTTNLAIAIYMVILVYSLLFGGFIVSGSEISSSLRWALRTSYFNFGFEALCINEFQDYDYGHEVLEGMSFDNGNKWVDVGALCGFFVFFRVLTYLFLRLLNREKR